LCIFRGSASRCSGTKKSCSGRQSSKAIAAINGYETKREATHRFDRLFFVPDDTFGSVLRVRGIMLPGYTVFSNRDARGGETHAPAWTVPREEPFSDAGFDLE
jgi:hypothetical protein